MFKTVDEAISTILSLGGDEATAHHDVFLACLKRLLTAESSEIADLERHKTAIIHGFSFYYWKWRSDASILYPYLRSAIERWTASPRPGFRLICELLDFTYFVAWCFENSSTAQCDLLREPIRAAANYFYDSRKQHSNWNFSDARPKSIVWIAMYAETSSPMSVGLRHCAPALKALGYDLDVYAWRFIDDSFCRFLTDHGVRFHHLARPTQDETLLAIEDRLQADRPSLAISDMNNAIPTALFSRRAAPIQIFLQAGMPAWPVPHLDAVFNSFGFDPEAAGWGTARMLPFNPPWDLKTLARSVDPEEIAAERALLPEGRLIGSYGRLAKVTEPYLEAAEAILLRCPDVSLLLGGIGDDKLIRDFIARSPAGLRIHVENRFVPGHVWGHILEFLLDTWPVTGGESCREMMAKGRPVVTCHSNEMPAIDLQRDAALVARGWHDYVEMATNLLLDPTAYEAACSKALHIARRMSDTTAFCHQLAEDLSSLAGIHSPI